MGGSTRERVMCVSVTHLVVQKSQRCYTSFDLPRLPTHSQLYLASEPGKCDRLAANHDAAFGLQFARLSRAMVSVGLTLRNELHVSITIV